MAADLIASSSDGAADFVQHQHQPRDQSNLSKFGNEEAATAAAAGKPALHNLHLDPVPSIKLFGYAVAKMYGASMQLTLMYVSAAAYILQQKHSQKEHRHTPDL